MRETSEAGLREWTLARVTVLRTMATVPAPAYENPVVQ